MTAHRLDVEAALVEGEWVRGDVIVDGSTIRDVGVSPPGRVGRAVPGFVDLQVNGFAGVSFTTCDSDGFRHACAALAARGTTAFLPTIPTAPPDRYARAMSVAADAIARPRPGARPLGVHLEGPFLSPLRHGAHDPRHLLEPDPRRLAELCDLGPVSLVTLAPELPGADRLVDLLRERGIVVSAGHSDATGADAHSAFDRGVTMVTHLWNAQRQITSREPGLAGVALSRPDVWVGIIADLVHVARETLIISIAAAGPRLVAVSDAVAVAGLPDGLDETNGHAASVVNGAARLPDGTLAGSAIGLDDALRNLVSCGLGLDQALATMTTAPASVLGRTDIGRLSVGGRADVVVLGDDLSVERVLVGGDDVPLDDSPSF